MSEVKFTKGGWEVANAHLIAAAPEMYTMLDFLVNELKGVEDTIAWDSVEELLAKARGE